LISLRVMRLRTGVLLNLLQADGGGDSAPSGYKAVRDSWKRREAFGSTGKTAESSARKACMKASVTAIMRRERRQSRVRCILRVMEFRGSTAYFTQKKCGGFDY